MTSPPVTKNQNNDIQISGEITVDGATRWLGKARMGNQDTIEDILIVQCIDDFYMLPLACHHAGAPLSKAPIEGDILTCPLHECTYRITGDNGLGIKVIKNKTGFELAEEEARTRLNEHEMEARIKVLEMELDAQRAANESLQEQMIYLAENMDAMISEVEDKKADWKEKSLSMEALNELVNRVVNSISDLMFITDPNGIIKRVNQPILDLFECREKNLLDQTIDILLNDQDLAEFKSLKPYATDNDRPILYQLCFSHNRFESEVSLRKDILGDQAETLPTPFLLRAMRLYDKHGKEEGAIFVISDLSQLKKREEIRRQKEIEDHLKLLQETLGQIGHGIAVFNAEGRMLVANKAFSHVLELPEEAEDYESYRELADQKIKFSSAPQHALDLDHLKVKPCHWESYYHDGKVVEAHSDTMPNGGFVLVVRDTTEQRRETETIRKLSYAIEQSPVEIMITDTSGIIEYVNKKFAENTGYSPESAVGQKASIVQSGQTPLGHYADLWKKVQNGENWSGEILNKRKDGSLMWQQLSIAPMYDPDGTLKNFLATKENIDERKKAEAELERHRDHLQELVDERTRNLISARDDAQKANQVKTEFLSSMSHELRTPLNGILGFAQLIDMKKDELSENHKQYIEQILSAGRHLLSLINDVLDLAKIESGKLALSLEHVMLSDVLEDALGMVENLAAEKGINVIDETGDQSISIYCDPTRFRQCIVNVLTNAIKYNRAQGVVQIRTEELDGSKLALSITDNGYGIAEDKMQNLFKPFDRLGHEGSQIEGSGIGLSLTQRIVDMMGGQIEVESQEGAGSTFKIIIDMDSRCAPAAQNPDGPIMLILDDTQTEKSPQRKGPLTILYVEDNLANQFLLREVFHNRLDIKLHCIETAEACCDWAIKNQPDLILMDILFSGMDGYDAFEELQRHDKTRKIPVVALSAHALPSEIEKARNMGFLDFLTKPLDLQKLFGLIQNNVHLDHHTH